MWLGVLGRDFLHTEVAGRFDAGTSYHFLNAGVAQLVEQRFHKPKVGWFKSTRPHQNLFAPVAQLDRVAVF